MQHMFHLLALFVNRLILNWGNQLRNALMLHELLQWDLQICFWVLHWIQYEKGHSERRAIFAEGDWNPTLKGSYAYEKGMRVILVSRGISKIVNLVIILNWCESQIEKVFFFNLEPLLGQKLYWHTSQLWPLGTGETASRNKLKEMQPHFIT